MGANLRPSLTSTQISRICSILCHNISRSIARAESMGWPLCLPLMRAFCSESALRTRNSRRRPTGTRSYINVNSEKSVSAKLTIKPFDCAKGDSLPAMPPASLLFPASRGLPALVRICKKFHIQFSTSVDFI